MRPDEAICIGKRIPEADRQPIHCGDWLLARQPTDLRVLDGRGAGRETSSRGYRVEYGESARAPILKLATFSIDERDDVAGDRVAIRDLLVGGDLDDDLVLARDAVTTDVPNHESLPRPLPGEEGRFAELDLVGILLRAIGGADLRPRSGEFHVRRRTRTWTANPPATRPSSRWRRSNAYAVPGFASRGTWIRIPSTSCSAGVSVSGIRARSPPSKGTSVASAKWRAVQEVGASASGPRPPPQSSRPS